jgi:hypothetical protein
MKIKVYTIDVRAPQWLKRSAAFVILPVVVVLGVAAGVRAATVPTLVTFNPGDTLSAANINANFKALQDAVNAPLSVAPSQITAGALPSGVTLAPPQIAAGTLPSGVTLASGSIRLGPISQRQGPGTPIGPVANPSYVGGDCLSTEILVGGGCVNTVTTLDLQTSAIDDVNNHWVCAFRNSAASAPTSGVLALSNCLKVAYP